MVIGLLLACAGGQDAADDPAHTGGLDSASTYLAPETSVDEALDEAALAAELEALFADVRGWNAQALIGTYLELVDGGDAACPTWTADLHSWSGSCESADGVAFSGSFTQFETSQLSDAEGFRAEGWQLSGAGSVSDAGRSVELLGEATIAVHVEDTSAGRVKVTWSSQWQSWLDGTVSASGWPEGLRQASLLTTATENRDGSRQLELSGTIAGAIGAFDAVVFEELRFWEGWGCPTEPSGTIFLQRGDRLYEIQYLTPDSNGDEPGCDGCGQVYDGGRLVGTVCSDYERLVDWTEAPW